MRSSVVLFLIARSFDVGLGLRLLFLLLYVRLCRHLRRICHLSIVDLVSLLLQSSIDSWHGFQKSCVLLDCESNSLEMSDAWKRKN